MMWNKESDESRRKRLSEWHSWFAWHPVQINDAKKIWFQWIERRGLFLFEDEFGEAWIWYVRLPVTD